MTKKKAPRAWEVPLHLIDLIDEVLCEAHLRQNDPRGDGETFILCQVCGEWDSHTDACPIPALKKWFET